MMDHKLLETNLAADYIKEEMGAKEAQEMAAKDVESMGATKTAKGTCPVGATLAMACMFCSYGHMTECHHPLNCAEANCSHYQEQLEYESES